MNDAVLVFYREAVVFDSPGARERAPPWVRKLSAIRVGIVAAFGLPSGERPEQRSSPFSSLARTARTSCV